MDEKRVQWHPGFVAALDLEFRDNRADLRMEREHNLNTKPLEIDLLVIKKDPDARIENEIGRMFRGHNILEYKSPFDHMNVDTLYKVIGYACLYKSYGRTLDEVRADDVTISLVRDRNPHGLFKYLREQGAEVSMPYPGIYYVEVPVLFPLQIIVTRELDAKGHVWLRSLSDRMKEEDLQSLLRSTQELTEKHDRMMADSVLDVSIRANREAADALLKGGREMCEALMELMEPVIQQERERERAQGISQGIAQGINQGISQGIARGIQGAVNSLRVLGHGDREIKQVIMDQYGLTAQEADGYLAMGQT